MMRNLSKSKILAYRQCPKRVWLEVNRPELREDSGFTEATFKVGHQVGDLARELYDPENVGVLVDPQRDGFKAAFELTAEKMNSFAPVFEAAFSRGGALALADVMLPLNKRGKPKWHMIEVKSSTSVKDYHKDDIAVQAYVAKQSGVDLQRVSIACIDSGWVYPGSKNYQGILKETDLSDEAFSRKGEVKDWIKDAKRIVSQKLEPTVSTGPHCDSPYACGFYDYCSRAEPVVEYPVDWLPGAKSNALKTFIDEESVSELHQIPDTLLNEKQLRVKQYSLSGEVYFDKQGAGAELSAYKYPAYFLDFETIQFAVPIWKGTRPYQQIPFQFSLHKLGRGGKLTQESYLNLSGRDPSKAFAEEMIRLCGERGPIYVYSAFEKSRINDLAERFPRLKKPLLAINARLVDLLPIARQRYYHPSQCGSWSIKKVSPAIAPDLNYEELDGVQDGGMAMDAFLEAIAQETKPSRKAEIEEQLLRYCELDTYAMVRLWQHFTGDERLLNTLQAK